METAVKQGILYGVSVGPGDPELLTLAAVRRIEQCPVLAAPQTAGGRMLALEIARGAVDISRKTILPLPFSMRRDAAAQAADHENAANAIRAQLDAGRDVAMLNLGDVSIYATFGAVQAVLQRQGYQTAMIAGVPSFCAAAARLNAPLTGGMDVPLTIAPGRETGDVLARPGTKVLMKSGRLLPDVVQTLAEKDLLAKSAMVCNCGLPGEEVYPDLIGYDPAHRVGYFATILVKE